MRCEKCREEVGFLHECSGPPAAVRAILDAPPPVLRFAPLHYLKQAIAIARFDEKAMLRNSLDNNAFLYGVPLWFIVNTPAVMSLAARQGSGLPLFVIFAIVAFPIAFLLQVALWGVCHLAARFVLRGKGSLAAVIRVMLLGSIVAVFAVIPLIGTLLAGLWGLAIMMIAFEVIHGIRRIHAFAISLVIGAVIRGVGLLLI